MYVFTWHVTFYTDEYTDSLLQTPDNSNFTYVMWGDHNLVSVNYKGEIIVSNSVGLDRETLENGTLFIKVIIEFWGKTLY